MKMHKSHLNERKQESNGSQNQSEEQQLMEGKYQNQTSHGKNGISHSHIRKYNQFISFGRIMPKQITHDKEHLYEDNIKLKEKIRFLEDQNLKLKTRVNIAEKETNQILSYYTGNGDFGPNQNRPGSKSVARNLKNSKQTLQRKNVAKKMIRQAQDEVSVLKKENDRIKRSVKYTQITELQVENQRLLEQTGRLEQYIRELIQNQNYEEYQAEILQLRQKLQMEKDHVKSINHQMKKKNDQCEELKEKLKQSQIQKISNEKKLSRDISILRGEIQKFKGEKSLAHSSKGRPDRNSSISQSRKCQEYEKQIAKLNSTLKGKDQDLQKLQKKLTQKQKQVISLNEHIKKQNSRIQKEKGSDRKKDSSTIKENKSNIKENKSDIKEKSVERSKQKSIEKSKEKSIEKSKEKSIEKSGQKEQLYEEEQEDYGEKFEEEDGDRQLLLNSDKNDKKIEDYEEEVYEDDEDFGQESKIQQSPNKSNSKKEEEEQVLFQKQKPKEKQKKKKEKKDKAKVDKALKETITYKLIAQRYTYEDFEKDINNSGVDEFSVEELATMLNNQPFYLVDQQLEDVLIFCFGKADIEVEDALDTGTFLKKMRQLINDIDIVSEEEEAGLLREVAVQIMKGSKKFEKAFKKVEDQSGTVSKKDFKEILKNTGKMDEKKIELCLGEACLISLDINHINYSDFLKRFNEDEPL